MEFLLPPGYGPVTVRHEVSAHDVPYPIATAGLYYGEGGFGHYLPQRVAMTEAGLQLNFFRMRPDITLDPFSRHLQLHPCFRTLFRLYPLRLQKALTA